VFFYEDMLDMFEQESDNLLERQIKLSIERLNYLEMILEASSR